MYSVKCNVYSVQCTVYRVQYKVYSVQCEPMPSAAPEWLHAVVSQVTSGNSQDWIVPLLMLLHSCFSTHSNASTAYYCLQITFLFKILLKYCLKELSGWCSLQWPLDQRVPSCSRLREAQAFCAKLSFTKFVGKNYQLQKESLEKSNERQVVSEFLILALKWTTIAQLIFLLLLLANHPTVHTGGVSIWRVQGYGCSC